MNQYERQLFEILIREIPKISKNLNELIEILKTEKNE